MLVKALVEWLASLWYEMVENILNSLLGVFTTDLSYFSSRVPVVTEMRVVLLAVGWALLLGNLVFQLTRSMASGIGLEGEEPQLLFTRSSLFAFLLVASPQICDIGLSMTSTITAMLQVPTAVTFTPFSEDYFTAMPNAGWIVVIIINIMIQWQFIKLFFEIAERYVILCVLTYCAPLAFSMGGARSTNKIFRGWLRMFASMCALMVFNVFFVKLVLSALSTSPSGMEIVPWALFITGIVRMAKKMDGIILRIGLNPATTGDPLGSRIPGMLAMMVARSFAHTLSGAAAANGAAAAKPAGGSMNGAASAGFAKFAGKTARSGAPSRSRTATGNASTAPAFGAQTAGAATMPSSDGIAAPNVQAASMHGQAAASTVPHEKVGSMGGVASARSGVRTTFGQRPPSMRDDAESRRIRNIITIEADSDFDSDDLYSGSLGTQSTSVPLSASGQEAATGRGTAPVPPTIAPFSVPPAPPLANSNMETGAQRSACPSPPASEPQTGAHIRNQSVQAGAFSGNAPKTREAGIQGETAINESATRAQGIPPPPSGSQSAPSPTVTSPMQAHAAAPPSTPMPSGQSTSPPIGAIAPRVMRSAQPLRDDKTKGERHGRKSGK